MKPRNEKKNGYNIDPNQTGLSYGVLPTQIKERKPSQILDFITHAFLFFLGGIILCGILYAVVSYT